MIKANEGDWLGTGTIAPQDREYRPFDEARAFVRSLGLKGQKEYGAYRRGDLTEIRFKPDDIPTNPNRVYKDTGWQSWGD